MSRYMTKQRKAMIGYLSRHADEELSAKQIEAALNGEDMLLVGEMNPLIMSSEERRHQKIRRVRSCELDLGGSAV